MCAVWGLGSDGLRYLVAWLSGFVGFWDFGVWGLGFGIWDLGGLAKWFKPSIALCPFGSRNFGIVGISNGEWFGWMDRQHSLHSTMYVFIGVTG